MLVVDTSVSVPVLALHHPAHDRCLEAIKRHSPAIAGHASIETFSVLTRLSGGRGLTASGVWQSLHTYFPQVVWPTTDHSAGFLERCVQAGITGGAVYDALVAVTALSAGATLVTLDRRAATTYRAVGVVALSPEDLV